MVETKSNRKSTCNCKKSRCLKLYCECFANQSYCKDCNCNCCSNTPANEEERQMVIKATKDRNPYAFTDNIIVAQKIIDEQNLVYH